MSDKSIFSVGSSKSAPWIILGSGLILFQQYAPLISARVVSLLSLPASIELFGQGLFLVGLSILLLESLRSASGACFSLILLVGTSYAVRNQHTAGVSVEYVFTVLVCTTIAAAALVVHIIHGVIPRRRLIRRSYGAGGAQQQAGVPHYLPSQEGYRSSSRSGECQR